MVARNQREMRRETPTRVMMRLPLIWATLAGLGAGLVMVALGAGLPLGLNIVWVAMGFVALAWSGAVLVFGRVIVPRLSLTFFLLPAIAWAGLLVVIPEDGQLLPLFTMVVAAVLSLYVAGSVAVLLRHTHDRENRVVGAARRDQHGWGAAGTVLGLVGGAIVVSALALPALSFTQAGQTAKPHSEHLDNSFGNHDHSHSDH